MRLVRDYMISRVRMLHHETVDCVDRFAAQLMLNEHVRHLVAMAAIRLGYSRS